MKNMLIPLIRKYQNAAFLWAAICLFLLVSACSDNGNNHQQQAGKKTHEHHHEGALLVSQSGSQALSLVHEGQLETLHGLGFLSAAFVRSDNGKFAAIKGGSHIYFANEKGVLQHTMPGHDVIASHGHFSVLDAGRTTLLEVSSLSSDSLKKEPLALAITEVYPAVLLDEKDNLVLAFSQGKAQLYQQNVLQKSLSCTNPSSVAQAGHAAIMSCDEGVHWLQVEHDASTGQIDYQVKTNIALDGQPDRYIWQGGEHFFLGYVPGKTDYALVQTDQDKVLEPKDEGVFPLTSPICEGAIESKKGEVLLWLEEGRFIAMSSQGKLVSNVLVDAATSTNCENYRFSAGQTTAWVIDNQARKVYGIDNYDGASAYHLHETLALPVGDIAASVVLFDKKHSEHSHE